MARLVTFGELLLRLSCPGHRRFTQIDSLEVHFAGAEANVAVAAIACGHEAAVVGALPPNGIGELARRHLAMWGVDTTALLARGERIGVYYLEAGTLQRPAEIIYDRAGSAFATTPPAAYDWPALLRGADWFHTSGINPGLSPACAEATLTALRTARDLGIPVSFDLNYRKKLWDLPTARTALEKLLPHVDLLIAGRGQLADVLGLTSPHEDFAGVEDVAQQAARTFGIPRVCVPRRGSGEATLETRAAVFFDGTTCHRTAWMPFEMIEPLGGGDAFAGALIAALLAGETPARAAALAVAAACVKHSIPGDFFKARPHEIEAFLAAPSHRGVQR